MGAAAYPDLELRKIEAEGGGWGEGGEGGGVVVLFAPSVFLPTVIFSFFAQNKVPLR